MTDTEQLETPSQGLAQEHDIEAALGGRLGWPFVPSVSGLYMWQIGRITPPRGPRRPGVPGRPHAEGIEEFGSEYGASFDEEEALPTLSPVRGFGREELRLDVDGRNPQMAASGTISFGLSTRAHWIADLTPRGRSRWSGSIWYKDGNTGIIPYTNVDIRAVGSFFASQRKARVKFSGGGAPTRTHLYRFKSPYFHPVEFEFDTVEGTDSVTSIDICDHPNVPDTLPCETLNVQTVFARAGFKVSTTAPGGEIPLSVAGGNSKWSNMEMHDAMQIYWSRFDNKAQWSMWTLFAALHDMGTGLGGIMFDSIGPNHRQGTAVFNDSFISNAPAGDTHPDAWVARMRFWTVCHEMGHSFNLAHSWQKQHPPAWGTPWIPMPNEEEVRSFMNYPYNVAGGQTAFFEDFEYRFSDSELLFMRHAPARFVQMGNADWFDNHGFEQAEVSPEPKFRLELRANRAKPEFEFLEPVVLEMKLTNITAQHQLIDGSVLSASDRMTVILKKNGKPAREWAPYARYLMEPDVVALPAGRSVYDSLFVAAGLNGWDLAEPGVYTLQICLQLDDGDIVSDPLTLRVSPPQSYDEEREAQDFFSEEVGRILAFDGSRHFETGNRTLENVVDRLGDRKVAIHAQIALATPKTREYKLLSLPEGVAQLTAAHKLGGLFKAVKAEKEDARKVLSEVLTKKGETVAETLGHIDYKYYVDQFSDWLHSEGDSGDAAKCQEELHHTLSERQVAGWVLDQVTERRNSYAAKKPSKVKQHA